MDDPTPDIQWSAHTRGADTPTTPAQPAQPVPSGARPPSRWRAMGQARFDPNDPNVVAHLVRDTVTGEMFEYVTGPDLPHAGRALQPVGMPLPSEKVTPPTKLVRRRRRG